MARITKQQLSRSLYKRYLDIEDRLRRDNMPGLRIFPHDARIREQSRIAKLLKQMGYDVENMRDE